MNVLITGANGLLGRNLVNNLSREHQVYAVIRDKGKINFELNKNINLIELNLYDMDLTYLPEDIDVIYYLAQSNRFREFPDGAKDMFEVNVNAPLKLCEWGMNNAVNQFIYASSGGVYTNPDKPVKEFFDINANEKHGFYLDSKLSAEILLKNYVQHFESFVIVRPFFMYGIGQNETMLIPRLIHSVKENKEILLSGKEGIKINPIYIDDATESMSKILELKGEYIINIAGEEANSLKGIALTIGKIVGCEPIFKYSPNMQNDLIADITVMKEELMEPTMSIEDGIKKIVNNK
jgi:nucleoside-diphosphate-sugar epimerase